ncbi:MAG: hypothetical protein NC218_02465 [Acetobacter sp.]|nr:hypothetical protein [Acetobacter sp.]
MTTKQAIERVTFRLGKIKGLNTRIELSEEDVGNLVQMSLDELVDKVDTPSMLILPYSEIIDVKKYKISSIDCVLRAEVPYGVSAGTSLDPFYLSASVGVGTTAGSAGSASLNGVLQMQASYAVRAMAQNTVQAELNYFHDLYKGTLMVSYAGVKPTHITILYRPEIQCVEDLPSNVWTTYLIRLATAHGKVIIGRWRAKYSVANSPATVNSEILAEGLAELDKLYEELKPLTGARIV